MKRFISILTIIVLLSVSPALVLAKAKKAHRKTTQKAPQVEEAPYHVPVELIDALKESDIDTAIRSIRLEAVSPRPKFLLKQMVLIQEKKEEKGRGRSDYSKIFNLAAAYHNLFLFLKGFDIDNKDFFTNAMKYYKIAARKAPREKRAALSVTTAALYAVSGDDEKATSLFKKVDPAALQDRFKGSMTLALYYSSMGDVEKTIENLKRAYEQDAEFAKLWVHISDDFVKIYKEPEFQSLLQKWKVRPRA